MQDDTLSREGAFTVLPELSVRADISVNGDRLDAEFLGQLRDGGIAVRHGRLRRAYLGFGPRKFSATFSPSSPGGFEARDGALADQFTFKFSQGSEDAEYQPPCSGGGVNLRTLPSQDAQADLSVGEVLHDCHKVTEVAA